MSRGKQWTPKMDEILLRWYADEESTKLAAQFGYGVRTIERHAEHLGLKKSPELLRRVAKKGSDAATARLMRMRASGVKVHKRFGGHGFEKGHRWDPETEERRRQALIGLRKKKNLEKMSDMSKFAPSVLRKMRTDELQKLLEEEMRKVLALRTELSKRSGDVSEARNVEFEQYVTK